ncbi:MAG TPA: hypothetical protein VFE08_07735 [Candidatus Sulfotelmatobacter sp.]|jgi:hypothetical protein|nr:hypothetical protein [Candidatus Sulfotelmatobacter sp.]
MTILIFLSLAEDERRWEFFVSTATGAREIPVYVDSPLEERVMLVQADEDRLPN